MCTIARHSTHFFDDLCDACALQSEVVRQVQGVIDEIVGVWEEDLKRLANIALEWSLVENGWKPDACLLNDSAESKTRRGQLLNNPHYSEIGNLVEIISAGHTHLSKLNTPGNTPLTPTVLLNEIARAVTVGRECVVTTFCLYLLYEKFPKCSDAELRKAEYDSFLAGVKGKAPVPPAMLEALQKACAT